MAIRLPLKVVLSNDNSNEVGAGSTAGGVSIPFTIPQDTDNIVVKFQANTTGGGVSALLQTTDDGGTTWFDVARTSIVSSAQGQYAQWLSVPVVGFGNRTNSNASTVATGSVVAVGQDSQPIGNAPTSVLGQLQQTGLPILSQQARIFLMLQSGVATSPQILTEVKVNSQSATA